MNSRGRRTQRRAEERRQYKADQAKRRELQRSFSPKKRKIKNEEESMGFFDNVFRGRSDRGEKASKAKTPPMAVQKPVYGDKKTVKAKNPKRKGQK